MLQANHKRVTAIDLSNNQLYSLGVSNYVI